MKRLCTGALVLSLMTTPIIAATSQPMIVNGMSLSAEAHYENGTLLIPLRQVGDLLNLTTYYLKETNQIIVTTQIYGVGKNVKMTLGSKTAIIDHDKKQDMVVPPNIISGSTYVPLRFISEVFGCSVNYSNGVVNIVKNPGISDINTTNKGYSTPIDSPDLKIPNSSSNTNNNNNYNDNSTNITQSRINYICDSKILMEYYSIIKESNDVLITAGRYNYSLPSYKPLADNLKRLSVSLLEENICTTEGKALQKAFVGELNTISAELTNVYNGKGVNTNNVLSTANTTIKAIAQFATAFEKVGM